MEKNMNDDGDGGSDDQTCRSGCQPAALRGQQWEQQSRKLFQFLLFTLFSLTFADTIAARSHAMLGTAQKVLDEQNVYISPTTTSITMTGTWEFGRLLLSQLQQKQQ